MQSVTAPVILEMVQCHIQALPLPSSTPVPVEASSSRNSVVTPSRSAYLAVSRSAHLGAPGSAAVTVAGSSKNMQQQRFSPGHPYRLSPATKKNLDRSTNVPVLERKQTYRQDTPSLIIDYSFTSILPRYQLCFNHNTQTRCAI